MRKKIQFLKNVPKTVHPDANLFTGPEYQLIINLYEEIKELLKNILKHKKYKTFRIAQIV